MTTTEPIDPVAGAGSGRTLPRVSAARVQRATTSSRITAVVAVVALGWLVSLAVGGAAATQTKIVEMSVFVVVASMWNLLAGYTGLVSIGQQAFVGLGAYALIVFANGNEWNIYWALLPAALVALLAGGVIAIVAFRLRGGYFAIGMWVIAEVVRLLVKQYKDDPIKGGSGTSLIAPTDVYPKDDRYQTTALLALLVAVAAILVIHAILRSRLGLALQAVRDDERGARGLGVDVQRSRYVVFVVAATFTGVAGAIWYLFKLRIQPDTAFGVGDWTAPIVVMVVIGGIGTIEGPIVGAVAWYLVRDYLTDDSSAIHLDDQWYLIVTGALAVLFALFVQRGIWGTVQRRFPHVELFPVRRRLRVDESTEDPLGGSTTPIDHPTDASVDDRRGP